MAIALVGGTQKAFAEAAGNGTSLGAAFPGSVSAGNLIVVGSGNDSSGGVTVSGVSDTLSNSYSANAVQGNNASAGERHDGHYAQGIASGGACTVTVSFSGSVGERYVDVAEFSGVASTGALDKTASATGNSTTAASGSVTTTTNGQLVWTGIGCTAGGFTPTSPFSQLSVNTVGYCQGSQYAIQGSAGAINGQATVGSGQWIAVLMSFKEADLSTIEQEGYRFRDDDGSETTASWLAAQDTTINRALSTNTRLRALLNATLDPASKNFQLEYRLNGGSYRKAEVPDGNPVAWGSNGTVTTTGTTAPTVAYPAGIQKGDLLRMFVINRPNASTVSTPSGWTAPSGNSGTGGAGSEAADTGTIRLTIFERIADGTESGNVSLSISGGTSVCAVIVRCTKGQGKDFDTAFVFGSDNSAGTSVSVAFGSDPGIQADDLIIVVFASSADTPAFASEALSQTGVTFGAMTERIEQAVTTGNDCKMVLCTFPVSSGSSSGNPTFTATASGTASTSVAGPAILVRIRQVDQPVVIASSSNITAGGENTTAQLTAPSGKSTSDFVAGRMQDDENPADALDITADDYTELEWCFEVQSPAVNSDTIDFRVTAGGTVLNTYSVTPSLTVGAGGGSPISPSGRGEARGQALLVGTGAVAGSASGHSRASCVLTGTGAVLAAGRGEARAQSNTTGQAIGSAGGRGEARASVSLTGVGAIVAAARGEARAASTVTGIGALLGSGRGEARGSAIVANGANSLQAVGRGEARASAQLTGPGSVTGIGRGESRASVILSATGAIAASGRGEARSQTAIANGNVFLNPSGRGESRASAILTGIGALQARARAEARGNVVLGGLIPLTARGRGEARASALVIDQSAAPAVLVRGGIATLTIPGTRLADLSTPGVEPATITIPGAKPATLVTTAEDL